MRLQDRALAGVGMQSEFQMWIGGGISLFTPWLPMARVQVRDSWVNDMYSFEVEKGGTIVDLGANIGVTSVFFMERFSPSKLICVEPDPELFSNYLKRNLQALDIGRLGPQSDLILLNSAIVPTIDDSLVFAPTGMDNGNVVHSNVNTHGINVGQITLDDLLADLPHVDLMKVDIEDSTLPVLLASELRKVERLHIENEVTLSNLEQTKALISKLENDGFQSVYSFFAANEKPHVHSADSILGYLYILANRKTL